MVEIIIEELTGKPVADQRVELVERKGTGHPDTICDGVMEAVSLALCHEYLTRFGRILHHNVDKCLLVAGRSEPRPGGGRIVEPMRMVFGDRATSEYRRQRVEVAAIAEAAARQWFRQNLRFVDPDQHVGFESALKSGSPELTDIFERQQLTANDTSAAVGFAPFTPTELLVLAAERFLNSASCKARFPEVGEDIKVMGVRRDRELDLTVAIAFVDRHVADQAAYFASKDEVAAALARHLDNIDHGLDRIAISINTLDDPERGEAGMYLTVLGTSAESGDCGQVGRGNRVNGLITLNRPMSGEAAAGKNPVSHVGKIYSLLAHQLAMRLKAEVAGLSEVNVRLSSQIGKPVSEPHIVSVQLLTRPGVRFAAAQDRAAMLIRRQFAEVDAFTARLGRGELPVW